MQRVGVLVEVPRLLREMNVEPAPFLASLGVEGAALADIESRLPFTAISDLLVKGAEATGRGDFNLLIGASARLDHLGVIGDLLSAAPNFRAALVDFVANHPRYVRGAGAYLIDQGEEGFLVGHRIHHPGLRGSALFSAAAAAFGRVVFAALCSVEPTLVLLSRPEPADLSPYRRAFGRAKLVFNAAHFGLVFSNAALAKPIPTADAARRAEIRNRRRALELPAARHSRPRHARSRPLGAGGNTVPERDRRPARHASAQPEPGAGNARPPFREAVKEARFEMASQLLRDTRLSVGGLARILGYSEVSAFTRFFTRMAGLPPSDWKQNELQGPSLSVRAQSGA